MVRVSKTVTINGVETTMLFTPRLFVIAEEQGIKLIIDSSNMMQTLSSYADMCYCAALNFWTLDNDIDTFELKRSDFHVWSASDQKEFSKTVTMAAEAITGKSMTEIVADHKKEAGESVKKKRKLSWITTLLKRF